MLSGQKFQVKRDNMDRQLKTVGELYVTKDFFV
jgi:hypothetical protein